MSQAATRTIANRIIGKEPASAVAREIALVTRGPRSLGRAAPTRGSSRVSLSFTDTPHLHAEPVWWPTPPRAAQPPDTLHDLGRTSLGRRIPPERAGTRSPQAVSSQATPPWGRHERRTAHRRRRPGRARPLR